MTSPLVREVLVWMGGFALAFAWGTLNYLALMRSRGGLEVIFAVTAFVICFIANLIFPYVVIPIVTGLGLLCLFPAWLEYQSDAQKQGETREWVWHFGKLLLATCQSFMVGQGIVARIGLVFPSFYSTQSVMIGLALTPPAISVFRWIWQTSKLRPGHDRVLQEGEMVAREDNLRWR